MHELPGGDFWFSRGCCASYMCGSAIQCDAADVLECVDDVLIEGSALAEGEGAWMFLRAAVMIW